MTKNELTVKLSGHDETEGLVDFEYFASFCGGVMNCLRRSERIVAAANIRYVVTGLECASAKVKVRALPPDNGPDRRPAVIGFFHATIEGMQQGMIDPRMQSDDVQAFAQLSEPLKHGIQVVIGRTKLTARHLQFLDGSGDAAESTRVVEAANVAIAAEDEVAEGFVTGMLDRLDLHGGKNEIVLFPAIGKPIRCRFQDEQTNQIRAAIKRNVTVRGKLHYRRGKMRPYRVEAKEMRIHPTDADLPTLHDVRAFGSWDTGGRSAVDFVRFLRDGDDAA